MAETGRFPGRCPQSAQSAHDTSLNMRCCRPDARAAPQIEAIASRAGVARRLDAHTGHHSHGCSPAVFSATAAARSAGSKLHTGERPEPHRSGSVRIDISPTQHRRRLILGVPAAQCKRLRTARACRPHARRRSGQLHPRTLGPWPPADRAAGGPRRDCSSALLSATLACAFEMPDSAAHAQTSAHGPAAGLPRSAARWICAASSARRPMAWRAGLPPCRPTNSTRAAISGVLRELARQPWSGAPLAVAKRR